MNFKRYHVSKNLFDYSTTEIGSISTTDGSDVEYDYARRSDFIPVQAGVTYTFSGLGGNIRIFEYKPDKTYRNTNYLYTIPVEISRTGYIRIAGALTAVIPEIMLNEGDTALPYEPYSSEVWHYTPHYIHNTSTDTLTTLPADVYANNTTATVGLKGDMSQSGTPTPTTPIQPQECGDLETEGAKAGQYKIPILSGGVTTPVYLGEVQSTRKIKKLVLTGEESWVNAGGNAPYRLTINDIAISPSTASIEWYCSHYQSVSTDDSWVSYDYCISRMSTTAQSLQFRDVTKGDITAFKQYLAQQYAAGTPVTIWYILATPTTGIVNEPIRKIGDYADEVSGISIPVTAGANAIDVDTTLKPSEVSATYKGWHPVSAVHERENGAWT